MLEERLKPMLGDYAGMGFELSEADDHILKLSFRGQSIATFNSLQCGDRKGLERIVRRSCKEHCALLERAENLAREIQGLSQKCQARLDDLNTRFGRARGV